MKANDYGAETTKAAMMEIRAAVDAWNPNSDYSLAKTLQFLDRNYLTTWVTFSEKCPAFPIDALEIAAAAVRKIPGVSKNDNDDARWAVCEWMGTVVVDCAKIFANYPYAENLKKSFGEKPSRKSVKRLEMDLTHIDNAFRNGSEEEVLSALATIRGAAEGQKSGEGTEIGTAVFYLSIYFTSGRHTPAAVAEAIDICALVARKWGDIDDNTALSQVGRALGLLQLKNSQLAR
jgi:hypothetical protein